MFLSTTQKNLDVFPCTMVLGRMISPAFIFSAIWVFDSSRKGPITYMRELHLRRTSADICGKIWAIAVLREDNLHFGNLCVDLQAFNLVKKREKMGEKRKEEGNGIKEGNQMTSVQNHSILFFRSTQEIFFWRFWGVFLAMTLLFFLVKSPGSFLLDMLFFCPFKKYLLQIWLKSKSPLMLSC